MMKNLDQLKEIAKLLDGIEKNLILLEKNYSNKNAEGFSKSKNEIILGQKKISEILK